MEGFLFEDLRVGMRAEVAHTITEEHIQSFSKVSGDTNPIHLDEDYAQTTLFKKPVVHGMLTASFISGVLGTKLPGLGSVYVEQNLRFKKPVFSGDHVITTAEITKLDTEKRLVHLKTQCRVDDKIVIDGEAIVLLPEKR